MAERLDFIFCVEDFCDDGCRGYLIFYIPFLPFLPFLPLLPNCCFCHSGTLPLCHRAISAILPASSFRHFRHFCHHANPTISAPSALSAPQLRRPVSARLPRPGRGRSGLPLRGAGGGGGGGDGWFLLLLPQLSHGAAPVLCLREIGEVWERATWPGGENREGGGGTSKNE